MSLPEASDHIQRDLEALKAAAPRWASLSPGQIIPLLEETRRRTVEVSERWVDLACEAKGLPAGSALRGEEWISGPWALLSGINGLIRSLTAISQGHSPIDGFEMHTRTDGQVVLQVYPGNVWDKLLVSGHTGEVWMQRDVTPASLRDHVATRFRAPTAPGLGVVLGAGNINAIPPLDALTQLLDHGRTCLVKLNPLNGYLLEPLTEAFRAFVERDFLRFVRGRADVGAWLVEHPLVDALHITGSEHTHDLIVWGPDEEGRRNKAAGTPRNHRPTTSELGGVGPAIVVPGPWSDADFRFQAERLVTFKLHNRGFNCVAAQVVVVPDDWEGTERLLQEVRSVLEEVADDRPDYYPGTDTRRTAFASAHPDHHRIGAEGDVIIADGLHPGSGSPAFVEEVFGPVWAVVRMKSPSIEAYLEEAVRFSNEELHGTLGCQILIHPSTEKEHAAALDRAVADLRYGTVGINLWCGGAFLMANCAWGAYPGHTLDDVGSGIGVVHNAMLLSHTEKNVVRGTFAPFPRTLLRGRLHTSPKPLWFVTHKGAEEAGRRIALFEGTRDPRHLPSLLAHAFRG